MFQPVPAPVSSLSRDRTSRPLSRIFCRELRIRRLIRRSWQALQDFRSNRERQHFRVLRRVIWSIATATSHGYGVESRESLSTLGFSVDIYWLKPIRICSRRRLNSTAGFATLTTLELMLTFSNIPTGVSIGWLQCCGHTIRPRVERAASTSQRPLATLTPTANTEIHGLCRCV